MTKKSEAGRIAIKDISDLGDEMLEVFPVG